MYSNSWIQPPYSIQAHEYYDLYNIQSIRVFHEYNCAEPIVPLVFKVFKVFKYSWYLWCLSCCWRGAGAYSKYSSIQGIHGCFVVAEDVKGMDPSFYGDPYRPQLAGPFAFPKKYAMSKSSSKARHVCLCSTSVVLLCELGVGGSSSHSWFKVSGITPSTPWRVAAASFWC